MICHGGAYVSTQILPKMIGIADFLLNLVTLTSYVKCLFVCVLLYNMPILNYLRRAMLPDRRGRGGGGRVRTLPLDQRMILTKMPVQTKAVLEHK